MTNLAILLDFIGVSLVSGGLTSWLFISQMKHLKTEFNDIVSDLSADIAEFKTGAAKDMAKAHQLVKASHTTLSLALNGMHTDITGYLDKHKNELKQEADRLRAHAQEMHDQAQARVVSRDVPTRGQ